MWSHEDDLSKHCSSAPPAQMLTSASSCEEGKLQLATEEIDVYRPFRQWSLKEASSVQCSCRLHALKVRGNLNTDMHSHRGKTT